MSNSDELVFLPLGGSGEIGMNLNLFGFGPADDRKWIIADIGVTFGGPDTPGIEIIMPDTAYIEERVDNLLGIILTHAPEDHMGALARLWPRLKCPVYATPFTMWLVKDRLSEFGLLDEVELHEKPLGSRFNLGPFDIEYITLTHSIPEPNGLAIRTPLGLVWHTGDWKIDDDPQMGEGIDHAALGRIKDEGVTAIICDSTNAMSPGRAGSEADVRKELERQIGLYRGKAIAVASFASNVARLESVMLAAKKHNRSVCLVGRSMRRMVAASKAVGLLSSVGALLEEDEAANMPQEHVLYLCTGSQGEPRAALSRIASDTHRNVKLRRGDVVIFSSKIIPGNEKGIFALQNSLAEEGIDIVTEKDHPIHVSGHPYQDELKDMYNWVKPEIAVPVHGERRHLVQHARLAKEFGAKHAIAPHNGEMIKLAPGDPEIIDIVPSGRLHQDGHVIVSADDDGLRERKKMAYAGHISVSLAYKGRKLISGPDVRLAGFPYGKHDEHLDALADEILDHAEDVFLDINPRELSDEDAVERKITSSVKRLVRNQTDKRAVVNVMAHKL